MTDQRGLQPTQTGRAQLHAGPAVELDQAQIQANRRTAAAQALAEALAQRPDRCRDIFDDLTATRSGGEAA